MGVINQGAAKRAVEIMEDIYKRYLINNLYPSPYEDNGFINFEQVQSQRYIKKLYETYENVSYRIDELDFSEISKSIESIWKSKMIFTKSEYLKIKKKLDKKVSQIILKSKSMLMGNEFKESYYLKAVNDLGRIEEENIDAFRRLLNANCTLTEEDLIPRIVIDVPMPISYINENLIRELSVKDGRTVLISSHQLQQIQQVCDRVGIYVQGSLIACGTLAELEAQIQKNGTYLLEVDVEPCDDQILGMLAAQQGILKIEKEGRRFMITSKKDIRPQLTQFLGENGYTVMHLHQRGGDLDEIYRRYFEKAGQSDESNKSETNKKHGWKRKSGSN